MKHSNLKVANTSFRLIVYRDLSTKFLEVILDGNLTPRLNLPKWARDTIVNCITYRKRIEVEIETRRIRPGNRPV